MKSGIHLLAFTIIIGLFSLNTAPASIVTDGLVSYWTFDRGTIVSNTLKDVIGNSNGTIMGNPKIVPGHTGDALKFDGVDDFVNLTTMDDFGKKFGTSTFEAWFNTSNKDDWMILINTNGGFCPIFGIQLNGIKNWFHLEFINGIIHTFISLRFDDRRRCGIYGRGFNVHFNDGKWHHIAHTVHFMMNNGKVTRKIYINGVLRSTNNILFGGKRAFLTFTHPVYLGARDFHGKTEGFFEGMIDEVRFYDRPLTLKEIRQNFESTQPFNVKAKGKLSTVWATLKTKL